MSRDHITPLDAQLLGLLRLDARTPAAALAKKLGVSRGTITNRITRMEAAGIIVGYTVRLRPESTSSKINAWMSIAVDGNHTREAVTLLLGEPGVNALHDTNGRWDLLAEIHAASIPELAEVLQRVQQIKGISATETSIHLRTFRGS